MEQKFYKIFIIFMLIYTAYFISFIKYSGQATYNRQVPPTPAFNPTCSGKKLTWKGFEFRIPQVIVEPAVDVDHEASGYVYAYSATFNFGSREAIREEFKKRQGNINSKFRLIFIIGTSGPNVSEGLLLLLNQEIRARMDLLQLNFTDTYEKLGFKGIGFFNWILERKKKVKYVAKIDDDRLIAVQQVFKLYEKFNVTDSVRPMLYCGMLKPNNKPVRSIRKKKFKVTFQQYNYTKYPAYCRGDKGMLLNRRAMELLLEASHYNQIYQIDDVYISGLLRVNSCVGILQ